jgi:hypothetical protein
MHRTHHHLAMLCGIRGRYLIVWKDSFFRVSQKREKKKRKEKKEKKNDLFPDHTFHSSSLSDHYASSMPLFGRD